MSLSKLTIVIPTFYPGKIIKKCLASLPLTSEIIIIDNGEDLELEKIIKLQKHKIKHYKVGDVGLSKSFNIALAKSKNENILITQPDVCFEKNSIINLVKAQKKYTKAGIISPLLFEKNKYSQYDYLDLSLSKLGTLENKRRPKKVSMFPSGDICVEAVNATAMLIKKSIIKKINGWDENIYTYHEDIDLCLRLRKKGYSIMKIKRSIAHHVGFGSNKKKNREKIEVMAKALLEWETINSDQIRDIMEGRDPSPPKPAQSSPVPPKDDPAPPGSPTEVTESTEDPKKAPKAPAAPAPEA